MVFIEHFDHFPGEIRCRSTAAGFSGGIGVVDFRFGHEIANGILAQIGTGNGGLEPTHVFRLVFREWKITIPVVKICNESGGILFGDDAADADRANTQGTAQCCKAITACIELEGRCIDLIKGITGLLA